jgi:hypothetical protein
VSKSRFSTTQRLAFFRQSLLIYPPYYGVFALLTGHISINCIVLIQSS